MLINGVVVVVKLIEEMKQMSNLEYARVLI